MAGRLTCWVPSFIHLFHGDYNTCGANDFIREVIKVARGQGLTDRVDGL